MNRLKTKFYHSFKPSKYKHTDTQEKAYLQRILGIPYDRRVGFASRNAVQVNVKEKNTQKVFRNHDEVESLPDVAVSSYRGSTRLHKIFTRYPCSLNQRRVEYGAGNQSLLYRLFTFRIKHPETLCNVRSFQTRINAFVPSNSRA